ncbi:hypothetical protein [Roseobacter ponti]|uniref:Translocase n=1 Tax=Roseobacter ponti TaxID=1891787 RepID=A0A858SM24_9RHOB|nr:hypothetical protein [Roseobacter ponti]QJF49775.1 hypothetical protein G3256_00625 [Roseobacter ponti]
MSHKTEIITAASTLVCALAIGFVMQSGEVAEQRYGETQIAGLGSVPVVGTPVSPVGVSPSARISEDDPRLRVNGIALTSAGIRSTEDKETISVSLLGQPEKEPAKVEYTVRTSCPVVAEAETRASAMLAMRVEAPCYAGETVSLSHKGVTFSDVLDASGRMSVDIPALEQDARVVVTFENGRNATAASTVTTIALYNRVIVQTKAGTGVQIHAREFGADYGQEGHVWSGAPRDPESVGTGVGGFLSTLGNPETEGQDVAQIYTYPVTLSGASSTVDLTVETEVTELNCGRTITASTMRVIKGGDATVKDLSVDVPGCETVGDYLVLINPLEDLKLAGK